MSAYSAMPSCNACGSKLPIHPLNLWLLPGRLGRTFQVTNKGLFFFSFRFTATHVSRAIRPTSPDPHPQPSGRVHTWKMATTGGEGVEGRGGGGDRKPGTINPQRSTHEIKSNRRTVRSSPTWRGSESKHIHALFIILKLWRDRFVQSQGAK